MLSPLFEDYEQILQRRDVQAGICLFFAKFTQSVNLLHQRKSTLMELLFNLAYALLKIIANYRLIYAEASNYVRKDCFLRGGSSA